MERYRFPRPSPDEYVTAFDAICELGLGPTKYADTISKASKKEAKRLWHKLVEAFPVGAEAAVDGPSSALEIVASDSLSGGTYPCQEGSCRSKNAEIGARFSALYADHIVVSDPLHAPHEQGDHETLRSVLPVMHIWRPLFESGIASHVTRICMHCAAEQLDRVAEESTDVERVHDELEAQLAKVLTFTIKRPYRDELFVSVKGPNRYFQHGSATQDGFEPLIAKALRKRVGRSKSSPLTVEEASSLGLVRDLARPIVHEFVMQQLQRTTTSPWGHYASNIPVDLELASSIARTPAQWATGLLDALTHAVPVVKSLPVEDIVRFRLSNTSAFLNYRKRVANIAKHPTDVVAIRQAAGELKGDFDSLDHSLRASRSGLVRKSRNELVVVGSIGVALAAILPPLVLAPILAALAGPTIRDAVRPRVSEEAAKNPLYFLWQLNKRRRR